MSLQGVKIAESDREEVWFPWFLVLFEISTIVLPEKMATILYLWALQGAKTMTLDREQVCYPLPLDLYRRQDHDFRQRRGLLSFASGFV